MEAGVGMHTPGEHSSIGLAGCMEITRLPLVE
jgi:hypothetical protein